jgi:hypothetical protein
VGQVPRSRRTPRAQRAAMSRWVSNAAIQAAGGSLDFIGKSYIKISRTTFITFYYTREVLDLRLYYFTTQTRYRCHKYLVCKEYW